MKHIKRLAFLFTLSLFASAASAQVSNADSMIHRLFSSLKNKDEKSFVTLYPNTQQMNKLVRGMMETMFKSEEMQKMMAMDEKAKNMNIDSLIEVQMAQMNKPETQAQMQKSYGETFRSIIEKGEKKGVNWSQAQLVSYTIDSAANANDEEMRMFAGSGIKAIKGVIDFRAGGTDYQMNYDKVLYIPSENGWFGGEFKQVIKKGESFALEGTDDHMDSDSTTTMDTAPAESKTKVKTKTPAGKTKTKTKAKA